MILVCVSGNREGLYRTVCIYDNIISIMVIIYYSLILA